MARRGGSSTQRQAAQPVLNGHLNGLPPPSTIPAQIVQYAAKVNHQHEHGSKTTLQLAPEIVHDFLKDPSLQEPDALFVVLISTIVEGGIDTFFREDPFTLHRLEEHGTVYFDALMLIFREKPHLALGPKHSEDAKSQQPPVFVWLFPKLLSLLAQEDLRNVHACVQDLLRLCLDVFFGTVEKLQKARLLLNLYQSCVENILDSLDVSVEEPPPSNTSIQIMLPSSSSIGELWPESQQLVALPQGLQHSFTSPMQVFCISFHLLKAILQSRLCSTSEDSSSIGDHHRTWALDSCFALWSSLKKWTASAARTSTIDELESLYLQILDIVVFPETHMDDDFSLSPKASLSFTSGLLDAIQSCLALPFSETNQGRLASVLTRLRSALEKRSESGRQSDHRQGRTRRHMADTVELGVAGICRDISRFTTLHYDLRLALCLWTLPSDWPPEVEELRAILCSDDPQKFLSEELNLESYSLFKSFRQMNLIDEGRPPKRRRTLPETQEDEHLDAYSRLMIALNGSRPDSPVLNLSNLHNIVQLRYANMPEERMASDREQCDLLLAFSKIACAGSHCIQASDSADTDQVRWQEFSCALCDALDARRLEGTMCWDRDVSSETWKDVVATMLAITHEELFQSSNKARVMMAVAIGRVFNHISDSDYLNLETCSLGEWLLKSMTRSLREARIAASRSLMTFLRVDIPKLVRDKNRRATMQFFAELTKRDVPSVQETLIMAYGQAAHVCSEVEFHIILGQLVEYLGHPNTVICGAAYNELSSLVDDLKTHPQELLRPYWRTIGFSVVNELHSKPQKAQYVCDFTGLNTVTSLLLHIHGDILPFLVLNKRKDILQRIASARKTTIEDVCFQPKIHLGRIIALLLCQTGQDVERRAMDTLTAVAPGFRQSGTELHNLIQLEAPLVACEVLKLAADRDEQDRNAAREGFLRLAALDDVKSGSRKAASKRKGLLELFVRKHILGIMAHFSDVVENHNGRQPLSEQKRCVGALREMISLVGADSSYALPQLRACLQSAMADVQLCDQAFDVWSALIEVLEKEHLELIIDQTFALVVHTWPSFSNDTQLKACKTLESLRLRHNASLQERVGYISSLASIPMLSKLEGEIARLKAKMDPVVLFSVFSERCHDESAVVVRQALKELVPFLEGNQKLLHQSAISQKPLPALTTLSRTLLDVCVRFADKDTTITSLCAQCLGIIGGLDPYRVETVREKKKVLVLSNFLSVVEVINFAAFMLEEVLIKVFLSTTDAKSQGYLAYLMQELCRACGFDNDVVTPRPRASQPTLSQQRWNEMPDPVRNTLSPFLNSKYVILGNENTHIHQYPIFTLETSHDTWLRKFAHNMLHKAKVENAREIFPRIARVARQQDLSIAAFILPFAVLSVTIDGEEEDFNDIAQELLLILETDVQGLNHVEVSNVKQCSENIFQTLDYLVLWLQEKRKAASEARVMAGKTGRGISEKDEMEAVQQMSRVERMLQLIPAKLISRRAVECGSYARALYHWEQYYREEQAKAEARDRYFAKDDLLQHLQVIYAQIDEPDSIEGISAHLQLLNPEQQIMEHRKAGRWTAAQSWYEVALAERPNDSETKINLLTCLKESGQYDSILNYVDAFHAADSVSKSTLPFAAEAAWSTGKWDQLEKMLVVPSGDAAITSPDFNVGIGKAMLSLRHQQTAEFNKIIESLRGALALELSPTATASLQASHDQLVKLHTLYELESISGASSYAKQDREVILENLDRRLDILGAYTSDKQYLLGVRRAAMQLSRVGFTNLDIASAWLTTARLLRKGDFTPAAFNSILHATQLGDDASKIEYSKMLWKEGHHRKAIQNIRGAIATNSFQTRDMAPMEVSVSVSTTTTVDGPQAPNRVKAHAQLLLAKWLDRAGQTQSSVLKDEYAKGIMTYPKWDKGHYYLGRYYLKLYETEKALPSPKQANNFLAGELTKLVIENYTRSTVYGAKYYYQTIPKVLTLWLDMGTEVINPPQKMSKELQQHKNNHLEHINKYIKRYASERMPAYPWYTAFPQIITRISHQNKNVWDVLQLVILKVAGQYPQQALWSLLAVLHSTQDDRRNRGSTILHKLRVSDQEGRAQKSANSNKEHGKRKSSSSQDLKTLITHGQRLTDSLLAACDAPIEQRISHVSLTRDLGFNMKLAPCQLVVPIEATMIPTLPSSNDSRLIRAHNPFPQDVITISEFKDDVLVLASLQRPRKLVVRGSDGRSYGLLCKPKDDLRKDQRLMEFNAMINRALTRDTEASKRRLYIKTYGVTPLNEECGTIEWIEGLKPMRDIIIRLYRQKNVSIDYGEIRLLLNEACADPSKTGLFTEKVLSKFQPVLHEWFVETFPEPEAWFAARLRYTRSCAVMSIVGHVLGLGDRHGENVLLEEGNGGTFHVDFNCLFDKGLTFEKPELVPFRLTHNMVDAMGPSGIEGPFRKTAELSYSLLRQHEDTLITILETFVHDPTADFLGGKRKKKIVGVAESPQEVLEIVQGKLGGFIRGESVPLSVEGYVDGLLRQARDPRNLAAMYIGWCAFF